MLSNSIISKPVEVTDVMKCLNEGTTSVNTLCRSDKINPYALFSPRWSEKPNLEITKDWTDPLNPPQAAGNVQNVPYIRAPYGVYVPSPRNITIGLNAFLAARYTWQINRPDANSYLSIGQFSNYNHNATVHDVISSAYLADDMEIQFSLFVPPADGSSLSISNLFSTPDDNGNRYYLCAVIFQSEDATEGNFTKPEAVVKSSNPITASGMTDVIFTNVVAVGGRHYTIVPFVCKKNGTGSDNFPADYDFYGTRIAESSQRWYETYVPAPDENIPMFRYFRWMENYGGCYPDGSTPDNGTQFPAESLAIDLGIDYCEVPESGQLYAKYSRIDIEVTFTNTALSRTGSMIFSWERGKGGNLHVDSRCENQPAYAHHLLMYIIGFWDAAAAQMSGNRLNYITKFTATLYDNNGNPYDTVTATQRSDSQ